MTIDMITRSMTYRSKIEKTSFSQKKKIVDKQLFFFDVPPFFHTHTHPGFLVIVPTLIYLDLTLSLI